MYRPLLFLLFLVSLAPSMASAQADTLLTPGAKVRFSFMKANPVSFLDWSPMIEGVVQEARGDTLVVVVNPHVAPLEVPVIAFSRLQVSQGPMTPSESALLNAGRGALSAAGVAPLVHMVSRKRGGFNELVETATLLAVLGAASGAIWGAVLPEERWRRIPLQHDLQLTPHIQDLLGLRLAFTF